MTHKKYTQDPPFAVQLEMVESCNLRCTFCGLNGIRGKEHDFKYMSETTLRSVVSQMVAAGWNPRIEWAMHGENTMHPSYINFVRITRDLAPRWHLMMTSNGGGLLRKPGALANVTALFEAGLNVLALDDYQNVNIVPKIREQIKNKIEGVVFYEYPEQPDGNPHRREHRKTVTFVQDISVAQKGTHAVLNSHCGAGAPPPKEPLQARCAKPFRELAIRWDGNVACCCNAWRGHYKCGNVVTDGLDAVWNGEPMQAIRRALYHGRRDLMQECSKCDAKSYRVGLLPDKFGKVKLPKPNAKDLETIKKAEAGLSYAMPVFRPWEKETRK